jgi:endonuclease/exonuclease/phosphatase (EEP) superfamily protein YafD
LDPASPSTTGRRRPLPGWVWLLLCALPWIWFAIRGTWAPLDVVAVAVPLVGVAGLVLFGLMSVRTGGLLPIAAGLSIFAVAGASVVLPRLPEEQPAPVQPVRIAAANVLGSNALLDEAAATLASRDVDVLVLIEARNGIPDAVEAASTFSDRAVIGQLSVLSRWPITELSLTGLGSVPSARLQIERTGAPFVLLVVHAPNPLYETTFAQQETLARKLVATSRATRPPAVIVGDLNLSDRVESYRIITRSMRDAMRAGAWPGDTYRLHVWRALLLRIDHLFVPLGWCAADPETFDIPGSDHRGIEATIGPCPV